MEATSCHVSFHHDRVLIGKIERTMKRYGAQDAGVGANNASSRPRKPAHVHKIEFSWCSTSVAVGQSPDCVETTC